MIDPAHGYMNKRHARTAQGFTLLEVSLVLFVMALLVGLSVYSFGGVSAEEDLRRPATELQRMTMEAVRRASLYEKPQVILFDQKGFIMRYRADFDGKSRNEDERLWQRRIDIPPQMKLTLRRWGSDKFAAAAGQRLIIAPSGLCEPLTARFELQNSWLEMTFDPLSGNVMDEEMNVEAAP